MEEVAESPAKKRKIEDSSGSEKECNTVSESQENSNPSKPKPLLQIKTASLARLRQAAKNLSPSKGSQNKDNVVVAHDIKQDGETKEDGESNDIGPANGVGNDVVISSTGSSPAHSPKPEDLTVLSTPPKHSKNLGIKPDFSKNLSVQFESPELSEKHENKVDNFGKGDSEKQESTKNDDDAKITEENEMEVEQETRTANESEEKQKPKIGLNAAELKKVLRAMIDEKFKQVEEFYQVQESENELYSRIARLEEENKSLQEYATKLEKAVKLLLNNQKSKKENLTNQWVQTDHVVLPPRPSSAPTKTISPPTTRAQPQLNQVNKPGSPANVTSRLTSTQAPIPGHSVRPDSHPQRVLQQQQQQQVRLSSSSVQAPRPQAFSITQRQSQRPPHVQYVQNARPVVAQGSVATPGRPTPVTVTVHPQTTPLAGKPNMILSPAYPNHPQKPTYPPNARPQPVQQTTQFVPSPANRPSGPAPVAIQRGQISQPLPGVVARPPPPQQGISPPRPPQAIQQYPNALGLRSPPNPRPATTTSIHGLQAQVVNNSVTTSPRAVQSVASPSAIRQPSPQGVNIVSPREQGLAQAVQTGANNLPPRPIVSIAVVSNGIVLSWNIKNIQNSARIVRYQLFALQDMGANNPPGQWKKIGVVNALPLPMACTLTQFMPGNKYHFTVRAQDELGRVGALSEPCTITLT